MFVVLVALFALPALSDDSPLVAAAKRSKRNGPPKSIVITNETLARTGGHLTTTKKQPALPKLQPAAAYRASASETTAAEGVPATAGRLDDAERDAVEGLRHDEVHCPTCLPMLKPSATLPLRKAELSANPPAEVKPQAAPIVLPKPPRNDQR